MTGPEHYKAAEVLIEAARQLGMNSQEMKQTLAEQGVTYDPVAAIGQVLAKAQVHATLALAAATALKDPDGGGFYSVDRLEWEAAASLYQPDVTG